MRTLRVRQPPMSGPDVSDWQIFLQNQGVLAGPADGVFGQMTNDATGAYQTKAGLAGDGIVGRDTFAKALIDGYQSTTGANIFGMDASVLCSAFAGDISAAGMKFAARYYSNFTKKAIVLSEAQVLCAAGINLVAVFEDVNNDIQFFSSEIGADQGGRALHFAAAIGQPAGSAIYFAVDFDPDASKIQGPVTDYFGAINDAFTAAGNPYHIGVYGSGLTCRLIRAANLASLTWLAQSIGFFEYASFRPLADIVQLSPERTLVAGLNIDDNIAQSANFGAFTVPGVQAADIGE